MPRMAGFLEFGVDDEGKLVPPDLHCPHGHRIPWEYAFHEAGYPRCPHRGRNGASDCNARLFVQFFGRTSKKSPPLMFIAEITYEELAHVLEERLDVFEILSYLGLRWPPGVEPS
jgi:hypothetical protein